MQYEAEVLDCECEDLVGNHYKGAGLLSLEADMSEFRNGKGDMLGFIAKPHTLFGKDCLFVSGTLVRGGNLEQIRLKLSNFSV